MGRGRGSMAGGAKSGKGGKSGRAGLLGLKMGGGKGSSRSTGPNEGLGAGQGKAGTPEDTKFTKDNLHPREMSPGQIAGMLPSDEEAPKGEVTVPVVSATPDALRRMAEKVDTEVLPAEYREQVLRYMESLRAPAAGGGAGEGGASTQEKDTQDKDTEKR